MILRPFQQVLKTRVFDAWRDGAQTVMMGSATGSGKTVVISHIVSEYQAPTLVIAHRRELVGQLSLALARQGIFHRVFGSSMVPILTRIHHEECGKSFLHPSAHVAVGGVDTIVRMDPLSPYFQTVRLVVQDEGHHVLRANKWGKAAALCPQARMLLATATPMRADGKGLGRHADGFVDKLVMAPSMRDIINMGYLTDYRVIAPPCDVQLDSVDISQTTGDYNAPQLRTAVRKSHMVGDVVQHYLKFAKGKKGICFAVDVEEAQKIARNFVNHRIPADVVSANTPELERRDILRKLERRILLMVVNVDLFGEGVDIPTIEVVILARPTKSTPLHDQQCGRGLRPFLTAEEHQRHPHLTDAERRAVIVASAKPYGLIIDHVNNIRNLLPPDGPRDWTLDRREGRGKNTPQDAIPLTACLNPECFSYYPRTKAQCPACGWKPVPTSRKSLEFLDGDLTELDTETLAQLRGEVIQSQLPPKYPFGATPVIKASIDKHHRAKTFAQNHVRSLMAWWSGWFMSQGIELSEQYRTFYFQYGVDVMKAQTLNTKESIELGNKLSTFLQQKGVVYE